MTNKDVPQEAVEAALRRIAKQQLSHEIEQSGGADYQYGYDAVVMIARDALSANDKRIAEPAEEVVVARPADLPEKDWHGWDLCAQAYITAQRQERRLTAPSKDRIAELEAHKRIGEQRRELARLNALTSELRYGRWEAQEKLKAAEAELSRLLRSSQEGVRIKLKPLEWVQTASDEWQAESLGQNFLIYSEGDPTFVINSREYATLEAAQADAQAGVQSYYERFIFPSLALDHKPAGGV